MLSGLVVGSEAHRPLHDFGRKGDNALSVRCERECFPLRFAFGRPLLLLNIVHGKFFHFVRGFYRHDPHFERFPALRL